MKAFTLLHSLSPTEKKTLDAVIKNHTREQVKNLYRYLRKTPRHQLNNERMYETTYGHPYKKEKDYLLRNELRLLGNEIKDFLVQMEIDKELKANANTGNYWYLKALRSRGLKEYYDAEYDKIYQKAHTELQFTTCMEMSRERMFYHSEGWSAHLDFEMIEQSLNVYRENLQRQSGNLMREIDLNHALFTRLSGVIQSKKGNITPFAACTKNMEINPSDHYSLAMEHLAMAHISTKEPKERHLLQALEHLAHCHLPGIPIERHLGGCYNALCLYYLDPYAHDLSKAALYAEKAFEAVFPDGPNPSVIYGNYLRVLNQAGQYLKAREVFDRYHQHFKNEANFPIILSAYLEGEAAYGDPEKAMEWLPFFNTREGINYNTFKSILVTAYMRQNLLELAHTEINNTLQNVRENNLPPEMENQFQLIRTVIRLKMQPRAKPQDLNKLLGHLSAITPPMLSIINRTVIFKYYYQLAIEVLTAHQIPLPQPHTQ